MDRKSPRGSIVRADREKKRKFHGNRFTQEKDASFASTSAEKLRRTEQEDIPIDETHGYRILQFFAVFSAISELVLCKTCKQNIKFSETSVRGLGFKIAVECTCGVSYINSCPLIKNSFEINRRIVFVMRLLGIGREGINIFCGLMDMAHDFHRQTYYTALEHIHSASKLVCELLTRKAVEEEKQKNSEAENSILNLTVSGDGSWKKRGFSSLFGVTSLIGKYSNKVIDIVVKSSYCKACEHWKGKCGTEEYLNWKESHDNECSINHTGSAGKMEVNAVLEMFSRSEAKYGVRYTNYIGDGDSKTFKTILDKKPYGDEIEVKKKECIGHVEKRMGTRLRNVKKMYKGIGGKGEGKLTDKLICDLTAYYGLAIRRCCDSVDEMKKAIWATFFHKCSSDENPQHMYCPPGRSSWCEWRRAESEGKLGDFAHKPPLSKEVQEAIKPIYKDLSSPDLLERCLGGNTQNNNESLNAKIWHYAPKHIYCGYKTIEIAAFLAACIFNEGFYAVLKVLETLDVKIGAQVKAFADQRDNIRIRVAEKRHTDGSKEARTARRKEQAAVNEFYEEEEDLVYGPGIAD